MAGNNRTTVWNMGTARGFVQWLGGALVIMAVKGVGFPHVLSRTLRELGVRREMEPFIGYGTSIVLGRVDGLRQLGILVRLGGGFLPVRVEQHLGG